LVGVRDFNDRSPLENFLQSWTARVGSDHSHFKYLLYNQRCGPARLAAASDVHSIGEFIIWIILCIDLAKSFGKGTGFAIGWLLLPIIFFPILGSSSAQYQGPAAAGPLAPGPAPQAA
jgi:hypothetical protein